ncbi:MAG: tetratricopeptide repeat protein, partial [Pseudomonadota bacterium]
MAVSSKKDKLIEEAQKLVLRGQLDKAVKIYEQVMALEPSAINLRQKLAELLIKAGRIDDARKEFETIGRHFSKNGFYLKAIAVYKQLQKLFPADYLISLTLAELNEKHGLTANALSEYKLVFDYYEKFGNSSEALKILDKMQAVDPGNVPIKIKLAEAYYQNNKKDESYALFSKTASILQERGENATLSKLNTRIQQLFPEKTGFVLEVFSEQIANGNAASIMNGLQGHLRSHPNDKRAWDLIVEAYRQLDQPQKIRAAYQHYFKFFPTDPVPMAGIISCHAAEGNLP